VSLIKFCSLYSGSSGNALFLSGGGTKILIDAGLSAKKIITALQAIGEEPAELSGILISHEHSDHIRGAGILSRKLRIPIYANSQTWEAMEHQLGPVAPQHRLTFTTGSTFSLGGLSVKAFPTPHDAVESNGFCLCDQKKKITVATDIGHISEVILNNLMQSDLIILESNHDLQMLQTGSYPYYLKKRIMGERGHLSNDTAGELAAIFAETGTRRFVLGHLSKENNRPELAYRTVAQALAARGIKAGHDVQLLVAARDQVSEVVNL
jgi:phosphoribosyl 1,2-cyclic phosphodiesterase